MIYPLYIADNTHNNTTSTSLRTAQITRVSTTIKTYKPTLKLTQHIIYTLQILPTLRRERCATKSNNEKYT
jgi:hypothetical protein